MNLIAKPMVKNQLWLITDGTTKVGNIEACLTDGYKVKIGDDTKYFPSIKKIQQSVEIMFETSNSTKKHVLSFAKWPTDGDTFNDFYDVKNKLHLFTKTVDSKCYHVAGYFNIKMNGKWKTILCPKHIFVERYQNVGPFKTLEQAKAELNIKP